MAGPNPFAGASEAFAAACTGFDPQSADELRGMFEGLPQYFEEQAAAMKAFVDKCGSEFPLKSVVVEALGEIASNLAGLQDHASEVNQTFLQAHEDELNRLDNPRHGEELWDVSRQNA